MYQMPQKDYRSLNVSRKERLLLQAKRESERSSYQQRVGCIIANGSRILARGHNQIGYRGKGISFTNFQNSIHAERDATSKLSKEHLRGATAYVARTGQAGDCRFAKPCEYCCRLFSHLGIKTVVYTTGYGYGELKL